MTLKDELGLPEYGALSTVFGAEAGRQLATAPGGWRDLSSAELSSLGLSGRQQRRLLAIQELVRQGYPRLPICELSNAADVGRVYGARLSNLKHEVILAVAVDGRNRFLQEIDVAQGGMHGAAVTPSDVLRPAIRAGASALIVVHNHPSGSPAPSPEDISMTRALSAVCDIVGVPLLDHVIVAGRGGGWASLAELGILDQGKEEPHEPDTNGHQRPAEQTSAE